MRCAHDAVKTGFEHVACEIIDGGRNRKREAPCDRDPAASDLGGPDFQRVRVNPQVDLALLARPGRPVFLGEPLAFALGFDPSAVNQEVQRTGAGPIGNGDVQTLLTARQRAEIRHRPIEPGEIKQAGH